MRAQGVRMEGAIAAMKLLLELSGEEVVALVFAIEKAREGATTSDGAALVEVLNGVEAKLDDAVAYAK